MWIYTEWSELSTDIVPEKIEEEDSDKIGKHWYDIRASELGIYFDAIHNRLQPEESLGE